MQQNPMDPMDPMPFLSELVSKASPSDNLRDNDPFPDNRINICDIMEQDPMDLVYMIENPIKDAIQCSRTQWTQCPFCPSLAQRQAVP